MKIILLQDISKLGNRFDIKDVNSGHALNFLIPKGLAVAATPNMVKKIEAEKAIVEGERKVQADLMAKNIGDLDGVSIEISGKANDKGHLFAGLHREDIAKELAIQTKLAIDPSSIQLEHPLKETGDHKIDVKAGGKFARFTVSIKAQ